MRIVFFGTPHFAKNQLLFLLDHGIEIVGVVTQPDKPKGRSQRLLPSPVKEAYLEQDLKCPLFQPLKASDPEFLKDLEKLDADLFIVVAYGQILRQVLLDIPKLDCINVHASLLPKYRGAAPIQRAIMAGEEETGITIMKMVLKLDAGDMILKGVVPITKDSSFQEIEKSLSDISGPLLLKTIDLYKNNQVEATAQDESKVTYAHKITQEDLVLDLSLDANSVHHQIQALSPKPGAFCLCKIGDEEKRIKILKSNVIEGAFAPFENHTYTRKKWIVGCGNNLLEILKVQLEGKKAMDFHAFAQGLQSEPKLKKVILSSCNSN